MRLSEILKPVNIKIPVESQNKTQAIGELVNLLAENSELTDPNTVLAAVLEREATRTTGIGNGLAIPHGKAAGLDHLAIGIGKPRTPIEFQSIDDKPVSIIWLLCSPPDQTGLHIQALARISRLMMLDRFRANLNAAKTAQELYDVISQQENAL